MLINPPGFLQKKSMLWSSLDAYFTKNTVDGRNPAPPGMYKTL